MYIAIGSLMMHSTGLEASVKAATSNSKGGRVSGSAVRRTDGRGGGEFCRLIVCSDDGLSA